MNHTQHCFHTPISRCLQHPDRSITSTSDSKFIGYGSTSIAASIIFPEPLHFLPRELPQRSVHPEALALPLPQFTHQATPTTNSRASITSSVYEAIREPDLLVLYKPDCLNCEFSFSLYPRTYCPSPSSPMYIPHNLPIVDSLYALIHNSMFLQVLPSSQKCKDCFVTVQVSIVHSFAFC